MKNLLHAIKPLANDLASSLFFAVLVAMGADVATATLWAVAFALAHVVLMKVLKKPIAPLQWASLGLVLVFGAAGLFLHDIRFLMAKPTIIYLIVATVMLKRGWMLRYMPPIAAGHGENMMIVFGYVWAGLLAFTGVLNLVVAVWFTESWPLYKAIFPITSKMALFAVQYLSVRRIVKRKVMAEMTQARVEAPLAA
jgi:intracellular septation protein A